MPANQFYPLATGNNANALTNAQWAALGTLLAQGFQSGVVPSIQFNTFLRQFSVPVSAIAQLMADNQSADVLDDGVVANFELKLKSAIQNISAYVTQAGQAVFFTASGGPINYTGTLAPAPTALTPDMEVLGAFGTANTTNAPKLLLNGIGTALPILKQNGGVPGAGDIFGFVPLILNSAGTAWIVNGLVASDVVQTINNRPPSGATFNTAGTTTWTCPAGVTLVRFELWGAGGAGGAGNQSNYGWGGAGGGYARGYAVVVPGTVYNITIGAGGVCPNVGSSGSSGGSSSFASFATANGGGGGPGNQSNVNGTAVALGGTASTGSGVSNPYTQTGGNGGAPLGPWTAAFTPGGGGAAYGGSGGIPAAAQLGQMGAGPGAGGAGGSSTNNPTGQLGGAGTVGTLLLSWQS